MNDETKSNEPSAALTGTEEPSGTALPPATFSRDRRKYTRFLDPLHTGPGLQLFESPEHEAFGDGLTFENPNGDTFQQSAPDTNYFKTDGGQLLSFGQILALAGDFYGVPGQPISDGTSPGDQQKRFQAAFNTLWEEDTLPISGVYQAQKILGVMQQQSAAVSDAVTQILAADPTARDPWSQAYSQVNDGHAYDMQYNIASGAAPIAPWWLSEGTYLQLAAVNWDHFGAGAVASYQAGHTLALVTAATTDDYSKAYAMEAFACHFLTDLFSSGHLRTPRKALHTVNAASDMCAQMMHDEDSYNGLQVQNSNGDVWTAYGDKRLNDTVNAANFTMARNAVAASLKEVVNAVVTKDSTPVFSALQLIPDLVAVTDRSNTGNWSPLYVVDNGAPKVRGKLKDLSCRYWTGNFWYISIYNEMPTGGVHSATGSPPGKATGLAHAIAWQKHRITGTSEDDLAPCAAIVTNNLGTIAGNTTPSNQFSGTLQADGLDQALQNTLCVVFRKTSSGSSNHHVHFLAIPMTDAPAFRIYTPSEIALGGKSTLVANGGDPSVVAVSGVLLMVYPDDNGILYQATWSSSLKTWSASPQAALSNTDSANYKLLAPPGGGQGPRVSMCALPWGVFMAFPTRQAQSSGNIVCCSLGSIDGFFGSPVTVRYADLNGVEVAARTNMSVGLTEYNGTILLAYCDSTAKSVCVVQNDGGEGWNLFCDVVQDANGVTVTPHSALSLVTYGGFLLLVVNDANGNITSYSWQQATRTWTYYQVQVKSSSGKVAPVQTKFAMSPTVYQGDAYVVFTDKANGAPSILTTAV